MAPVLGYWGVRGLGNQIRYLLEYTGENYEFKDYNKVEEPGWSGDKLKLGMPFPNLPYLIDGDVKLSQSGAIMRYLARKHNLVAKNDKDQQQQDVLDGVLQDVRTFWGLLCYMSPNFEKDKETYRIDRLKPVLKQLEDLLTGKQYLLGDHLNYNDFILFEILDINAILFPDLFDEFHNLHQYHDRIGNLKGIKEFLHSDRCPKKINGDSAKWGG